MTHRIRPAVEADLPGINYLYNHFVETSHVTFDIAPWSGERRREWFAHYSGRGRHRVFVATDEGGAVRGYASSSAWRPKQAYETSVETSLYVATGSHGHGIGRSLYETLFSALASEDVHRAYAGIALPNDASVALHAGFGFVRAALFTEQGRKFGRYWDVAWFEKRFDQPRS